MAHVVTGTSRPCSSFPPSRPQTLGTATSGDNDDAKVTKHDDNVRCDDNARSSDNAASDELDGKAATTTVTTPALGTAARGDNDGAKATTHGGENAGHSADGN